MPRCDVTHFMTYGTCQLGFVIELSQDSPGQVNISPRNRKCIDNRRIQHFDMVIQPWLMRDLGQLQPFLLKKCLKFGIFIFTKCRYGLWIILPAQFYLLCFRQWTG